VKKYYLLKDNLQFEFVYLYSFIIYFNEVKVIFKKIIFWLSLFKFVF